MEEITESAQPWMKNDDAIKTRKMLAEAEKRKAMSEHKNRYKILADLLAGRETDITGDPQIFGVINKERMAIEDYMQLFPEHISDALEEANRIRQEMGNGKDYNPKSLAKWRIPGIMPRCVAELYMEVYEKDHKAMGAAFKRFFNEFPAFRISDKRI